MRVSTMIIVLAVIVLAQTAFDSSVHLVQWLGWQNQYPLEPHFSSLAEYNGFWFTYYAIAAILCLAIVILTFRSRGLVPQCKAVNPVPPRMERERESAC